MTRTLRQIFEIRPIALRWLGVTLIALVLLLQGLLSYSAWRQYRINTWSVNLPIDMGAEKVFKTTFRPISRWENYYILLLMHGPKREEFRQYTSYRELKLTDEIRHVLSNDDFEISWRITDADRLIESGAFSFSEVQAYIYPEADSITYKAKSFFNLNSNFSPDRTYLLEATVKQANQQINQFNPMIQIQTGKSSKDLHPVYPGSILALSVGIGLLLIGIRRKD